MVKVTSLLVKAGSGVRLSFGVRARTEVEIRCVKGMFRLKLISSEKNSGFKGLRNIALLLPAKRSSKNCRIGWLTFDNQHTCN